MCVTVPAVDRDMGGLKQTNLEEDAEGLHGSRHRTYKRGAPEGAPLLGKEGKDVCRQCGATETPQWRNGPLGPRTLCNACGIRLHRQSQRSGQPYLRVKKKISKLPVRVMGSVPNPATRAMHGIKNETADDLKWSHSSIEHPNAVKHGHSQGWRQFAVHGNFAPNQGRPKRKAAVAAVETTRRVTQGLKKGQNNTWVSTGTHTVVPLNHQHAVPLIHTGRVRGSIEPVDFTGAVDLVGLSRASTIKSSPGNTTTIKLEELGQDLLSHLTEIPQTSLLELQGIECELLSAHWEMQASEMALKAVAKVLTEQKEETIKKKTRYWRARDRLEKFIHTSQSLRKRSDK